MIHREMYISAILIIATFKKNLKMIYLYLSGTRLFKRVTGSVINPDIIAQISRLWKYN